MMAILSPLMTFIVDKEIGFPIPSEKEKINRALRRYRQILSQHPKRSDAPEILFGIADLLVGRNDQGDYPEAMRLYDQILLRNPPEYLKARALVGKAELLIGTPAEFGNAISLCEKAREILGNSMADFFAAKTYIVEAELRAIRRDKGDWAKAIDLINRVVKEKKAHWYFRGRALLTKAEILIDRDPHDLGPAVKFVDFALKELAPRKDDYFTLKGKTLKAEILMRREKKGDLLKAEKLLAEVIKMPFEYKDLVARAKIDLATIVAHPKAHRLLDEVYHTEGLDNYLIEKARFIEQAVKNKEKKPARAKKKKGLTLSHK